jgi:hypothetical protein
VVTVFCTYPGGGLRIWLGFSTNFRWVNRASTTMPMSMVTARPPSSSNVVAAFLLLGGLNAGTPLEMASTPVSAAQPEENVRSSRKPIATWDMAPACSPLMVSPALGARRSSPSTKIRNSPVSTMPMMTIMKP